ncbi:MAG: hypothetical protein ABSD88_13140 [Candidatus Korobacteraceae bacterium]|jgi:hypothetical protein
MVSRFLLLVCLSLLARPALGAKAHVISFGKVLPVKLFIGPSEERTVPMTVRALLVDGDVKEFTTGKAHIVTDRILVVRRAFRLNNNLPGEFNPRRWVWQRGEWLLVDRLTGRITRLKLAYFDPFYSQATWFRDYAAYCGLSDDGTKIYGMVMQLGRNKPVLRQELGAASQGDEPDADCAAPAWEKNPVRVTFLPQRGQKAGFAIRGRSADPAPGSAEEE